MSKKCSWDIQFRDGTTVTVAASGKKSALGKASIAAHQHPNQIVLHNKRGKGRSGNRAWRDGRSRYQYSSARW